MIKNAPTFTLKACRVNKNLTIAQVSKFMGVSEKTDWNWENYNTIPNGSELRRLSELFGIKEDLIFLGDKFALSKHFELDMHSLQV